MNLLTTEKIIEIYGEPEDWKKFLVSLELPYAFYLDWDLTKSVKYIACHKLIKDRLEAAFKDILQEYGQTRIHELCIDQYGGCFNNRPQRGYETQFAAAIARGDHAKANQYLSRHSWGIAIDLDPNRNTLRETSKTARFARSEYSKMLDIFEKHGFLSYGRAKGYDWMHIETAI